MFQQDTFASGAIVYWADPDGGISSGLYIVVDWNGETCTLRNLAGSIAEVLVHELQAEDGTPGQVSRAEYFACMRPHIYRKLDQLQDGELLQFRIAFDNQLREQVALSKQPQTLEEFLEDYWRLRNEPEVRDVRMARARAYFDQFEG